MLSLARGKVAYPVPDNRYCLGVYN
jgi:hypothetical protein